MPRTGQIPIPAPARRVGDVSADPRLVQTRRGPRAFDRDWCRSSTASGGDRHLGRGPRGTGQLQAPEPSGRGPVPRALMRGHGLDLPMTSSFTPAIQKDPTNATASVRRATGREPTGGPLSWTCEAPFPGGDRRHLEPTSRHAVAGVLRLWRGLGRSARAAVPGPRTRGPEPHRRTRDATSASFPAAQSPRHPWGGLQGPARPRPGTAMKVLE